MFNKKEFYLDIIDALNQMTDAQLPKRKMYIGYLKRQIQFLEMHERNDKVIITSNIVLDTDM